MNSVVFGDVGGNVGRPQADGIFAFGEIGRGVDD